MDDSKDNWQLKIVAASWDGHLQQTSKLPGSFCWTGLAGTTRFTSRECPCRRCYLAQPRSWQGTLAPYPAFLQFVIIAQSNDVRLELMSQVLAPPWHPLNFRSATIIQLLPGSAWGFWVSLRHMGHSWLWSMAPLPSPCVQGTLLAKGYGGHTGKNLHQ